MGSLPITHGQGRSKQAEEAAGRFQPRGRRCGGTEIGDADLRRSGIIEEGFVGLDADDLFALVNEDGLIFEEFHARDGGREALHGAFDDRGEEVVGDFVIVGHAKEGVGLVLDAGLIGGGGFGLVDGAVGGEEAEIESGDGGILVFAGGEDPEVDGGRTFGGDFLLGHFPFGAVFGAAHGARVDEGLCAALGVIGGAAGESHKREGGEGGGVFHLEDSFSFRW